MEREGGDEAELRTWERLPLSGILRSPGGGALREQSLNASSPRRHTTTPGWLVYP